MTRASRIVLVLTCVLMGFVGGLVLTGRMRSAAESKAQDAGQPEASAQATHDH